MKILLVCAGGMSTSILMKKVEKYAAEQGIEPFEIAAVGVSAAHDEAQEHSYEVCLVGPQVGYQMDSISEATGLPTAVISTEAYGNADSAAVIALARETLESVRVQDVMVQAVEAAVTAHEVAPDVDEAAAAPDADQADDVFTRFFNSAPMRALQAGGAKLQQNKAVQAITGGMMGTMGLILAGAVFTIVATLLNVVGILPTESFLYQQLQIPYQMTMNCMAIAVAFCVAYAYTKNLGKKGELSNGIVAMVLFLMVAAPFKTVELADGSSMTVMDTTYLGGVGLFTALIIPIIAVKIIVLCEEKNLTIKMPEVVPQFLVDSFSSLIPLVICTVLFRGLAAVCETLMGAPLPGIIMGILGMPLAALASGPGVIVLGLIAMIFWCFGMHGSAIVYMVIMAPMITAYTANAELVAAGQAPVFNTVMLFGAFVCCGGTGNVLPLAVHMLRAKSEKLRSVGKVAVVPAVFNISEPMVFGAPLMYNPILDVPFILNGVITALLMWVGYAVGFFKPGYVLLMTALPVCMSEFLSSMSWQNLFIPVLAFVVGYLVYAPFVRMYDKQCLAEEAQKASQAA